MVLNRRRRYNGRKPIIVKADGTGDFKTVKEAQEHVKLMGTHQEINLVPSSQVTVEPPPMPRLVLPTVHLEPPQPTQSEVDAFNSDYSALVNEMMEIHGTPPAGLVGPDGNPLSPPEDGMVAIRQMLEERRSPVFDLMRLMRELFNTVPVVGDEEQAHIGEEVEEGTDLSGESFRLAIYPQPIVALGGEQIRIQHMTPSDIPHGVAMFPARLVSRPPVEIAREFIPPEELLFVKRRIVRVPKEE